MSNKPKLKGILPVFFRRLIIMKDLLWKSFLFQTDQGKTIGSSILLKDLNTKPAKTTGSSLKDTPASIPSSILSRGSEEMVLFYT